MYLPPAPPRSAYTPVHVDNAKYLCFICRPFVFTFYNGRSQANDKGSSSKKIKQKSLMIRPNDECSPRLEGATQRERDREIDACLHLGISIPVFIAHRQRQRRNRRNRKHSGSESSRDNGHTACRRRAALAQMRCELSI